MAKEIQLFPKFCKFSKKNGKRDTSISKIGRVGVGNYDTKIPTMGNYENKIPALRDGRCAASGILFS